MKNSHFIFYRPKSGDKEDNVLVLSQHQKQVCKHEWRVRNIVESGWRHVCKKCGVSSR